MNKEFEPIIIKELEYYKEGFHSLIIYYKLSKIKEFKKEGLEGILTTLLVILLHKPLYYKYKEENVK